MNAVLMDVTLARIDGFEADAAHPSSQSVQMRG